ncbi:TRAP transporter large permease [Oceanobacillus timonensis]|uniref:TRAP transporter large permease n=1 Tax=Oceanobacillus timonensis TaxID=1926285 RepID=UPI0009BAB2FE|nr:TRAP transporter large permease [Oceanobacillus timonensis]
MTTTLIILILLLLLTSAPIFVAFGLAAFLTVIFITDIQPVVLVQQIFGGIDQFALMALPFFIFAANIMDAGGLSDRLMRWARALVGHVTGGVAMTAQVSSMFFGALSGSGPATVMAIGKIMYPEMLRAHFKPSFASGLLASAGAASLIIPPSITLIVFGSVTGTSIGDLFLAGIGAGIVIGISSIIYIYFYSCYHQFPRNKRASLKELLVSTRQAIWALIIPIIILGGIYGGFFTPTEAAGVIVIYALIVSAFIYRQLTLKQFYRVCVDSATTSAQILVLVASAQILGWLLTRGGVPQQVATFVSENISSAILFLLILNLVLLVMGMMMEGIAAIVITAPLLFPAATALGIDPVHFGIIIVTNLAIGMYTPPFGMNIFVAQSVSKLNMLQILPGVMKFVAVNLFALLVITYVPDTTMFLVEWISR